MAAASDTERTGPLMHLVVTVPKTRWAEWLDEGDLACDGDQCEAGMLPPWSGDYEYGYNVGHRRPPIVVGERLYIVAYGRLRGYSPVVGIEQTLRFGGRSHGNWAIVRRGAAVAVTVPWEVQGFRGYRFRTWHDDDEIPFPDWKTKGVA